MSADPPSLPPAFAGLRVDDAGVPVLTSSVVRRFRTLVEQHFRRSGRSFPWRQTREPYRILVSEIMLQQTQTERVARLYSPFLERFPTIEDLAAAGTRELLAAWRGLGYNRRALALRETARIIVAAHRGRVPKDPAALVTLPGIGPATAAEIAAFAYGVPSALVETNIRRVFLHFFFPHREGVRDRQILPLVELTLDRTDPRKWYYGLMDYGVMMKKALPPAPAMDPNRRSAHYTRQPRFEGSDRQIRGRVLRVLGETEALAPRELRHRLASAEGGVRDRPAGAPASPPEPERLERILDDLEREGFVVRRGGRVRLP